MAKKIRVTVCCFIVLALLLPSMAMAGGGGGASELIVVADTRVLMGDGLYTAFMKYMADAYNHNMVIFATWCTVLTAAYGALLGFLMDWLMSKTGLDLKSRKILEH
ncbi:MAG: DVU0150 family protein [Thermodesulfobacteriota bacterium]